MKRICLVVLALLLLSACGGTEHASMEPATTETVASFEAESAVTTTPTTLIELDKSPFELALQEHYANWREGYLAILHARWKEYVQLNPRSPEIVFCLTDTNQDGVPELLVKLYVIADFIHDEQLFAFEAGKVCLMDTSQYPEPAYTDDLWGHTDSEEGISTENFNRAADAFENG